jgi:tetratricopeptide (TPR) repeat protein
VETPSLQEANVMHRRSRYAWVIATILLQPVIAIAETPADVPGLTVGVIPFERTGVVQKCPIEAQIKSRLGRFDIKVKLLDTQLTVESAFARHPEVDVIVTGLLTECERLTVLARVTTRGSPSPRSQEAGCSEIVSFVAQCVTDELGVGRILQSRETLARSSLESDPQDFDSLMTLGLILRQKDNWTDAFDYFSRAVMLRPGDLNAQFSLALCYKSRNDAANWLRHLSLAEQIDPDDDGLLIGLGNYHARTGDSALAIGYYDRALKSERVRNVARWNLAILYVESDDLEAALTILNEIPRVSPYYPQARAWIAQLQKVRAERRLAAASGVNLATLLGFPEALSLLLVALAFTFFLVPYFGGRKFHNLEIPQAPPGTALILKIVGPILLVLALGLFPPVFRLPSGQMPDAPASIETDSNEASAVYLRAESPRASTTSDGLKTGSLRLRHREYPILPAL